MDTSDPGFCFYDDPELPEGGDADALSPLLQAAHRQLWNKRPLGPGGEVLDLSVNLVITNPLSVRGMELASDTIATAHNRYRHRRTDVLWQALSREHQRRYERGFYRLGGFIVFPRHRNSLNQRRGTHGKIDDRFDLTLECIRLYYAGLTATDRNPLGDVLLYDSAFFDLFGHGTEGFKSYVDFFHLHGLVIDGRIRWFDDSDGDQRLFVESPLPKTLDAYVFYLDNVLAFVNTRTEMMVVTMSDATEIG